MNYLTLHVPMSQNQAKVCLNAISPDCLHQGQSRSNVSFSVSSDGLKMDIEAQDLSSLRAAVNTYFRLIVLCLTLIYSNQ